MNSKKVFSLRWMAYVLPMFFILFSFEALSQGSVSIVTSDASTVETTGSNVGFDLNVNIGNSLPADADGPLIIEFVASASSSATEGDDFIVSTTTVNFTPGDGTDSRTQTAFDVVGDDLVEGPEVVSIELSILSSPTNYTYINAGSEYSLTLNDNDASTISISSTASASEGDDVIFTISMTNPSDLDTEVTFQTSETGTATEDVDYVGEATGITVTFPAGDNTSQSVNVSTIDEAFNINESDETFSGIISDLNSNGRSFIDIGNNAGTGTILNDDPVPTVTINPGSAIEGSAITMSVQLSNAFGGDLELAFAASDGTATVGTGLPDDVDASIANLLFTEAEMAGGTLSKNITINTFDDSTDEPSEDFTVSVSSIVQGSATPSGTGLGTITDNDNPPTVTIEEDETGTEGGSVTFTVQLSNPSSEDVILDFSTTDGTAVTTGIVGDGESDFGTPNITTFTFTAAAQAAAAAAAMPIEQNVVINLTDDDVHEDGNTATSIIDNESFTFSVAPNASNTATLTSGTDSATGNIIEDDAAPNVTIVPGAGVAEGSSQTYTATLSRKSNKEIIIDLQANTGGGNQAQAAEFTIGATRLTFPALSQTHSETNVQVAHGTDDIDEGDDNLADSETYEVTATNSGAATNGLTSSINTVTGNIIDDDVPPTIAFSGETDTEGNSVDFTFSITNAPQVSDEAMVINVITSVETGDDAEASDYTTLNSTVTFPALSSGNQTAPVATIDDTIDEVGTSELETFTLTASINSGSFSLDNTTATGTIQDADDAPALTIGNPNVTESESTETASFSLNLTVGASGANTSSDDIILDFTTTPGSATADTDYDSTPNSITATIPAGSVNTTAVTVDVFGDTDYENGGVAETFMLNAVVNGASVGQADVSDTGDASIIENDPAPEVTISDAMAVEGNQLSFTVSLDRASVDEDITVLVSTSDGTAEDADTGVGTDDYEGVTNFAVTFTAGDTEETVLIDSNADNVHEGTVGTTENFFLNVSSISAGSASGVGNSGEGTIEHDDAPPLVILAVSDNGVDEDTETATIRAILTGNTTVLTVDVDVDVSQSIAIPGTDFNIDEGNSSFTLSVDPGQTQSNVATLTPVMDNIYEDEFTETVTFEITGVVNGTESGTQEETLEILDSDAAPVVNISSETEDEGTDLIFTVELGADGNDIVSANDIVIDVTTTGGTAEEDVDYTGKTETVTIPAGSDNVTFTVTGTDDTIYEQLTAGVEDFTVSGTLNGTSPGGIDAGGVNDGTGTIRDVNDAPEISISVSPASPAEIAEAAGVSTVTLDFSGTTTASEEDVTVDFGFTGTAEGSDYVENSTGSVVITAGNNTNDFTVTAVQDNIYEGDETVQVDIVAVTNGTEGAGVQTITITDDDPAPEISLSLSASSVNEGNSVTLTASIDNGVTNENGMTVDLDYNDETTNGTYNFLVGDFSANPGSIFIPAGSNNVDITLTANDDVVDEENEDIGIEINGITNGGVGGTTTNVTLTLNDNDAAPSLSGYAFNNASITEFTFGSGGSSSNLIATADVASEQTMQVAITSTNTTAEANDYSFNTSTITIPIGSTSASSTFVAEYDGVYEPLGGEQISVSVAGTTNITDPGVTAQTLTIEETGNAPSVFLVNSATVTEGASLEYGVFFSDNGSGDQVDEDATIEFGLGAATSANFVLGADYNTDLDVPETITISALSKGASLTVPTVDDTLWEDAETLSVDISASSSANEASYGTDTGATGVVNDNDTAPTIALSTDATINEDDPNYVVAATLSAPAGKEISIGMSLGGTATGSGTDYTNSTIPATIPVNPSGATSNTATFEIDPINDNLDEYNETIAVSLSSGMITVTDEDQEITLTDAANNAPPNVTVTVAPGGQLSEESSHVVTATLDAPTGKDVMVNFMSNVSGTAINPDDYIFMEMANPVAVALDGVNDHILAGNLGTVTEGTFETWVYLGSNTCCEGVVDTQLPGGGFRIETATNQLYLYNDLEGGPVQDFYFNGTGAFFNTWVHLAFTWDATNTVTGYFNGVQAFQRVNASVPTDFTSVVLGGAIDASSGRVLTGQLSDVRFWSEARTANEIASNINKRLKGTEDGLLRYFPISEGAGATLNDLSGNGSATLVNGGTWTNTSPELYEETGSATIVIPGDATTTDGMMLLGVVDDDVWEGGVGTTESVDVDYDLSLGTDGNPTGNLSATQLSVLIEDNEKTPAVRLSIDKFVIAEDGTPENGQSVVTFSLVDPDDGSTPFTNEVQDVDITLALSGEAVDTEDYSISGTNWTQTGTIVTIPQGMAATTITVTSIADVLYEGGNESAFINVASTAGADIYNGSQNGNITITEGDDDPVITIADVAASEADGSISFTITSTPPSDENLNIAIDFMDGTAVSSGSGPGEPDFDNTTINVVLLAGDATTNTSVSLTNDNVFETDESFTVYMNDITGTSYDAVIDESDDATLTITNDDARPTVSLSTSASSLEENLAPGAGWTGEGSLEFWYNNTENVDSEWAYIGEGDRILVTLQNGVNDDIYVYVTNVDGSSFKRFFWLLPNGTYTDPSANHIAVSGSFDTGMKLYIDGVDMGAPGNGAGDAVSGPGTPVATSFGIGNVGSDIGTINFEIDEVRLWNTARTQAEIQSAMSSSLSTGNGLIASYTFESSDGTDATGTNGNLSFAGTSFIGGAISSTALSVPGGNSATGGDIAYSTTDATVTATLSEISTEEITVDLGLGVGSSAEHADLGSSYNDFSYTGLTLTIPAGSSTASMGVASNDDNYDEIDENIVVDVVSASPVTATTTGQSVTITIMDDDAAPDVEINNVSADEDQTMTFDVFLTGGTVSDEDMIVDVSTMDTGSGSGYAIAGTDYTALSSQSVTISARSVSNTVDVTLTDDSIDEVDEVFDMFIANATSTVGVGSTSDTGTGTVSDDNVNDDTPIVNMDVETISSLEDNGSVDGEVTIFMNLSNPSSEPITIDVITVNGNAMEGLDFIYTSPTSIVVPALSTSLSTTVTLLIDDIDEFDETFQIGYVNSTGGIDGSGADLGPDVPTEVTITDNDDAPVFTFDVADVSELEANGSISFDFTLSNPSSGDITIDFSATGTNTMEDPAELNDATFADDFNEIIASVTVSAGSLTGTAVVDILDDATDEFDEEFTIDVSGSSVDANGPNSLGATDTSVGIILDDDDEPAVLMSVLDDQLDEAVPESTDVVFNLIGATEKDVTVDLVFNDGITAGSGIADINVDYSVTGTQVIIPAGDTQSTLTISSIDESPSLDEINETIFVEVDAVDNGIESGGVQDETVIIIDGDLPPVAKLTADASVTEGTGSGNAANVTVTLHDPDTDAPTVSSKDVTVYLETLVNDAIDGSDPLTDDYSISNLTLTIEAFSGSTTTTALNTIGDAYDEMDEDAEFRLYDGVNSGTDVVASDVTVDNTEVITTIQDDDNPPVVDIAVDITNTDEQNAETLTYTVSVDQRSNLDFTLDVTTSGSATVASNENLPGDPEDYSDPVGSVSFSAAEMAVMEGNIFKTFTVTVNDDGHYEIPTETAVIDISVAATSTGLATVNIGSVSTNINNDEALPVVSIQQFVGAIDEDEFTPTENINIFSMDRPSQLTTTVNFDISGDAIQDSDYTISGTTLVVQPGATTSDGSIDVTVIDDAIDENTEVVTLTVGTVTNADAGVVGQVFNVNIIDNEAGPEVDIAIDPDEIFEEDGVATITATLSEPSGLDVTITLGGNISGTADEDDDYTIAASGAADNEIIIPAGATTGTIQVLSITDTDEEGDELALIDIVNVDNGSIGANAQVGVTLIEDNDPPAGFSVNFIDPVITTVNETNISLEILGGEEDATFDYTITDGTNLVTGSGTIVDSDRQEVNNIDLSIMNEGEVTVTLTLTDDYGNTSDPNNPGPLTKPTDTIDKLGEGQAFPQGFSPNNDGVNDFWVLPGIEAHPDNLVVIFNRYGKIVWQETGYDNSNIVFDGVSNSTSVNSSASLPDGTYFYVVTYGNPKVVQKGFIIIRR